MCQKPEVSTRFPLSRGIGPLGSPQRKLTIRMDRFERQRLRQVAQATSTAEAILVRKLLELVVAADEGSTTSVSPDARAAVSAISGELMEGVQLLPDNVCNVEPQLAAMANATARRNHVSISGLVRLALSSWRNRAIGSTAELYKGAMGRTPSGGIESLNHSL